jgi:hypothetical protein
MNNILLIANCVAFWFLFGIWSSTHAMNMIFKLILLAFAVLNTLMVYNILNK